MPYSTKTSRLIGELQTTNHKSRHIYLESEANICRSIGRRIMTTILHYNIHDKKDINGRTLTATRTFSAIFSEDKCLTNCFLGYEDTPRKFIIQPKRPLFSH